jgi:predicted transposase YbfD/YdcC
MRSAAALPKKTVTTIRASGNHYLIKVKANQARLLAALKVVVGSTSPLDVHEQAERGRGRVAHRSVARYAAAPTLDPLWQIRHVLHVVRSGWRAGAAYRHESYYISSRSDTAAGFAQGIRGHWLIENQLHYVKDVQMQEDRCGIKGRAARTLSLLKSLVLSCYRAAGYRSCKAGRAHCANKIGVMLALLRT